MTFAKIVLWFMAIATLAFGAFALLAPVSFGGLAKIGVETASASTEIRAFYGGVEIGLAAFWIYASMRPGWLRPALVSVALVWGLVAASRALGMALDDSGTPMMLIALGTEVIACVAAIIALRRLPASVD